MPRPEITLAFDDIILGTANQYSSAYMDLLLGEYEAYNLQAIIDPSDGKQTSSITVQLETSGDGRNWVSKNSTAEINAATVTGGVTNVIYGVDGGANLSQAMVRLRVALAGASPSARVRIYVREAPASDIFVPMRIQGLQTFLRGDLGIVFDSSGNVQTWRDMSGQGHHGTAPSGRRPTIAKTQTADKPAVFFDATTAGSEKYFTIAGSYSISAAHVFLVHKRVAATPPDARRAGIWDFGSYTMDYAAIPWSDGNIYEEMARGDYVNSGAPVTAMNVTSCYEVRSSSAGWSNYINGTSQSSAAANFGMVASCVLGGFLNAPGPAYYDGYIAEFLLYDHILSTRERATLIAYVKDRYRILMT